jgi:hypothetical protein
MTVPSVYNRFKIPLRRIAGRLCLPRRSAAKVGHTPAWGMSIGVSQKRPTNRFWKPFLMSPTPFKVFHGLVVTCFEPFYNMRPEKLLRNCATILADALTLLGIGKEFQ